MAYENAIYITYQLSAAATSAAGTLLSVKGPAGKTGRLHAMGAVTTTAVTVATANITVGVTGTLDKFGSLALPVATVGSGYNAPTVVDTDTVSVDADSEVLLISTDGGSTAGAADIAVTMAWY